MEHTLILLKDSRNILVSDGERTPRSKYYDFTHNIIVDEVFYNSSDGNCKKIIAGLDSMPSLYYSDKVKQILRDKYGWVDVESLAFDLCEPKQMEFIGVSESDIESFIKGFKAHQSITNKMFSLEEIEKALNVAFTAGFEHRTEANNCMNIFVASYLQSIQKPIQLKVEVEMENDYEEPQGDYLRPKINKNNSILITKILKP